MFNFTSDFNGQEVRIQFDKSGYTVFSLKDVGTILGYKNTRDIKRHIDGSDMTMVKLDSPSGIQTMICVNEYGLYDLILASHMPKAKEFKRWVTHEVLPQIGETGRFIPVKFQKEYTDLLEREIQIAHSKTMNRFNANKGGKWEAIWYNQDVFVFHSRYGNTPEEFLEKAAKLGMSFTSALDAAEYLEPETAAAIALEKKLILRGCDQKVARQCAMESRSDLLSIHTRISRLGMLTHKNVLALA